MGSKILLVEDNQLNADMLLQRLTRKGYDMTLAIDGEDAVRKANKLLPDLILMDMGLPVLDGWDATHQLKTAPKTKHIPVLALTAHSMLGDRKRTLEAGCDDYDTKPVDFPRLIQKIEKLLDKHSK